jgi:hypothetical protein
METKKEKEVKEEETTNSRDELEAQTMGTLSSSLRLNFQVNTEADFGSLLRILNGFYVTEMSIAFLMLSEYKADIATAKFQEMKKDLFENLSNSFIEGIEEESKGMENISEKLKSSE